MNEEQSNGKEETNQPYQECQADRCASKDEEAIFLRGARVFFERSGQKKRRLALASLARTFRADRHELKRYLRFKGLVNLMD